MVSLITDRTINASLESPLVSVRIITFQHNKYIKKCIESVLNQRTNFLYEICIGDDGSTDGTFEICCKYSQEYPNLIRVFSWSRNCKERDKLPVSRYNFLKTIAKCRGKYIALLDGDDYWTDSHKLQNQVDILEKKNEVSIVTHNAVYMSDENETTGKVLGSKTRCGIISKSYIIRRDIGVLATTSMVVRREVLDDVFDLLKIAPAVDYYLILLSLLRGDLYHINQEMCVKRRHNNSLSGQDKDLQWYIEYHQRHMSSLNMFNEQTNNYYNDDLKKYRDIKDIHLIYGFIQNGFIKDSIKHSRHLFNIIIRVNFKSYFSQMLYYLKKHKLYMKLVKLFYTV